MIKLNAGVHHAATVRCKISEAQIRKHSKDPRVTQLKDERYSLYLRFRKNREQGSWVYMEYKDGDQRLHTLGKYPNLSAPHVFDVLNYYVLDLAQGKRAIFNEFETVDELLVWHLDRENRSQHLSAERIISLKCMVDLHLVPRLHGERIAELTHRKIEKLLMKPLRENNYSISYIRSIFQALKVAFKKAKKLKMIGHNPLTDMVFTDFITAKIEAKGCSLKPGDAQELLEGLCTSDPFARVLGLLMLSHGSRIGETRKAKWCNVCFKTKRWKIPKHDTKTKREVIYPLTDEMVELLKAFKAWQLANYYKGNNVFPQTKRDKAPISRVSATELVKTVSKGKWCAHDLRKLARTIWADIGIDYLVGETLLNHAKGKLDQAYIHTHIELQKLEALRSYHQWLKNCWRSCYLPTFE
ncbi:tyrosine-type recombinase/integrase [Vibrio splendidus]